MKVQISLSSGKFAEGQTVVFRNPHGQLVRGVITLAGRKSSIVHFNDGREEEIPNNKLSVPDDDS